MDPITSLHNAARHYCLQRIAFWHQRYSDLRASGKDRDITRSDAWTYTKEAYDAFPRYNILAAILGDIEHYCPSDFSSVKEIREALALAAETAVDPHKDKNPIERAAQSEERRLLVRYIETADLAALASLPRLPFRRVLGDDEQKKWDDNFKERWGEWYGGYEGRIVNGIRVTKADALPHITIHTQAMQFPGAYDHLRATVAGRGISRVFELREWGDGYELDISTADFQYTGAEGFWTTADLSWMVYASHESSITFGGDWLIQSMQGFLPEFKKYLYKSWALEDYENA